MTIGQKTCERTAQNQQMTVIDLDANSFNSSTQRYRPADSMRKQYLPVCCLQERCHTINDRNNFRIKGWKKRNSEKWHLGIVSWPNRLQNKTTQKREGILHTYQKNNALRKYYNPKHICIGKCAHGFMKEVLLGLKPLTNFNKVIVDDFSILLSSI